MIREYDPSQGDAPQGDVDIFRIPDNIKLSAAAEEIKPVDGRLIIQEGELTGHHHAIELPRQRNFRQSATQTDPTLTVRDAKLHRKFGGGKLQGIARLYRDSAAIEALRQCGELTRTDLAIGILVVEDAPVVLRHDEHDGIRLPVGRYYCGRQVESAGAEQRVVKD